MIQASKRTVDIAEGLIRKGKKKIHASNAHQKGRLYDLIHKHGARVPALQMGGGYYSHRLHKNHKSQLDPP